MSEIKFLVFADFHYKKRMYPSTVAHLDAILQRALDESCELIVHEGDFCNNYVGSREITRTLLSSPLPVFGIYGNHELESAGNTMAVVTPLLTNRADCVAWGTKSGKIENGSIAYYYYDIKDFRFIFLDANYSLMPDGITYEHNKENSWTMPAGNSRCTSLGSVQLAWLDTVLTDAASRGLHCIINAHPAFYERQGCSPDSDAVRALYKKANRQKSGTVIMSVNGHYHTDGFTAVDGVYYFDVNVAINGWWQSKKYFPYANPEYTFDFTDYDENGKAIAHSKMPYASLSMGAQTQFFKDPLSAIVTVTSNGRINVSGSDTEWAYGITRDDLPSCSHPEISNYQSY